MKNPNLLAMSFAAVILIVANGSAAKAQTPAPPPTPEERLKALEEFKEWFHESHKSPQEKVIGGLVKAVEAIQNTLSQQTDDIKALGNQVQALEAKIDQSADGSAMTFGKEVKALQTSVNEKASDIQALQKAVKAIQAKVGK